MHEERSTPTDPRTARRSRASRWLLALVIVGSALALGSLYTAVLCIDVAVLALAAFLAWWGAEPFRARPAATILLFTAIGLTAWTLLQVVPLPASWLAVLAPANADVWTRALAPLHEDGPRWVTLSLDPIATRIEVLRGVAYVLAFLVALRVAHRREGSIFLERVLLASAVIMAMTALLHPAFGATKVFGVYRPMNAYAYVPNHLGPLLNSNHLSGYMALGVCVALAVVLSPRPGSSRALAGACVLLCIGTQLWAESRGGTLAILLGIALVPSLTWLTRKAERRAIATSLVPIVLAAAGIGVAVLSSAEQAWSGLSSTDTSKALVWKQSMRLVAESPWLGIGRGAFESVFPAVRRGTGYFVFTHPENVIVQWVVEWGLPVALVAGGAVLFALRPASLIARSRPAIGAWAALACLAAHNLVDFTSEVPGVMIALVTCAAMVVGGSAGAPTEARIQRWSKYPRRVALASALAAAAAIVGALGTLDRDLTSDQHETHDLAVDPRGVGADAFHATARAAMLRHPGDPYIPFVGAVRAARAGDESVIPWIGRALERSPVFGPAHLVLARWLAPRSPAQARLEYRLAVTDEPFLGTSYVMSEAPRLVGSFEDAMEVVPDGPRGVDMMDALSTALAPRLPATSVRLDHEILARSPRALGPRNRAVSTAIEQLREEDAAPWCARAGVGEGECAARGLETAKAIIDAEPTRCAGYAYHAQVLAAEGEVRRGLDELTDALERVTDRASCVGKLLELAVAAKDDARISETVDRLARAGCPPDEDCGASYHRLAQVEESRGNTRRALAMQKRAFEVSQSLEALADEARLAALVGLHVEAFQDYRRLADAKPGEAKWAEMAAAEKAAIAKSAVPIEDTPPRAE